MNQKLAEERELFGRLSVAQLEELATDSAALIAKARLMARSQQVPPAGARLTGVPVEGSERSDAGGPKFTGPDVDCSGNTKRPFEASGAQSRRTLVLVDSPSPAAGGDHVVTGERAEPSTTAAVPDDQDAASGVTVPPEGR
jgi:hypothetical protein